MKKIISIIAIVLFCVMIIVPTAMTNNKQDAISTRDNRRLSQLPWKVSCNGETFTEAANNYMNDRIGLRDNFITLNSAISYYVFNDSPNKNVIMGDNGWLFYNPDNNGNAISQYLGMFFASTFWTKLQNIFGHCCMSKLDKVAKRWPVMIRPAI